MDIEKMKKITMNKHKNQIRKQGTPYFLHPFAVTDMLKEKNYNEDYQIAGMFHDLLEDTETTYEEILKLSNYKIAEAVKLVTKEKDYDMQSYIKEIKQNEIAKIVKLADRVHNLSEAGFCSVEFRKKYIIETEKWYINLAKGTIFETELNSTLNNVKKSLL